MPFVALDKTTGKRIDITEIEEPRKVLRSGDCLCQDCEQPLIVKVGFMRLGHSVSPHFAHYADRECTLKYKSHPETLEHREGKRYLAKYLRETYKEYTDSDIEKEVPIPEIMRKADLLVTLPMGWRIAHEIQLAAISIDELEERTNDYSRAGIDVVWWLGGKADNYQNRDWCIKNFGSCFTIKVEKQVDDKPEIL
jgi:competence CoiA-like predicted nuclease